MGKNLLNRTKTGIGRNRQYCLHMRRILTILMLMTFYVTTQGQEGREMPLWPEEHSKSGFEPTLTVFRPQGGKVADAAVVVCPGGGYTHLAAEHEGVQVAAWLNKLGITAVMLKYHHMQAVNNLPSLHPLPLQDAQRAIQWVRSRAAELKVDPGKIGILGFSAGGHLASSAATHFREGNPAAEDPVERLSSRPDFAVLLYPVITFQEPYLHRGSRDNLLGKAPADSLVKAFSNETRVNSETPPAFLAHTDEDKGVPAENSLFFYQALRKAGVPAEIHIFQEGRHGLGLGPEEMPFSRWPELCEAWLKANKFLQGRQEN